MCEKSLVSWFFVPTFYWTRGVASPFWSPIDLCDMYVSSNFRRMNMEPRLCIMYNCGQQPERATGPGKNPGPANGSPKGERTTERGMSAG